MTSCNSDSNCPAGFICEDKVCVAGCLSDEDCDERFECSKHRCVEKPKPEGFVDLNNNAVTIISEEKQKNITIGCIYADPNCSYTHFDVLSDFADGSLFTVSRNDSLCKQRLLNDEDADPRSYTGYVLSLKSSESCEPDTDRSYCDFLFKLSAGYDENANIAEQECKSIQTLSNARVIKPKKVEYLTQPTQENIEHPENGRLLYTGDPFEIMAIFDKNIVIDSPNGVSIYIEVTKTNKSIKLVELKNLPVTSNIIKFRYIIQNRDTKINILFIKDLLNVSTIDNLKVKEPENSIPINRTINDINYKPNIDCDI